MNSSYFSQLGGKKERLGIFGYHIIVIMLTLLALMSFLLFIDICRRMKVDYISNYFIIISKIRDMIIYQIVVLLIDLVWVFYYRNYITNYENIGSPIHQVLV